MRIAVVSIAALATAIATPALAQEKAPEPTPQDQANGGGVEEIVGVT